FFGNLLKESGVTPDEIVELDPSLVGMVGRMDTDTDPQLAAALKAIGE
ncbi:MAG: hypothetical protein HUJ65_03560, partial [Oscillospiraceae bacterium]|nr:hypothetical protein [Oscillospiraceae bacterium]